MRKFESTQKDESRAQLANSYKAYRKRRAFYRPWSRITTKFFDSFRIIALKQQTFSESNPVLIRQFSKKL